MVRSIITILIIACWSSQMLAQEFVVRGTVRDATDKKVLVGANVSIKGLSVGTASDSLGDYKLTLQKRAYTLTVSYIGYTTKDVRLSVTRDINLDILLESSDKILNEVTVTSDMPDHNFNSTDLGVTKINVEVLNKMPAFMGERDILKSVLLLPGVSVVGEGTTGINVRGGNADQNLILMDGAPLFNTSHLMGFLSVFNSDVVDNFTFYKGGVPANFGGRVSSILDTKLRTPGTDRWKLEGGVGLVANRLLVEGKVNEKISFYVAGRLSFPDYLFRMSKNPSVNTAKANFYDITGKIDYQVNERHRLTFSTYRANDNFKLAGDSLSSIEINAASTLFNWQSNNQVLTWNNLISDKTTLRTSVVQSLYDSKMYNEDPRTAYELTSNISYRSASIDLGITPNAKNSISVGVNVGHFKVSPGTLQPTSDLSAVNYMQIPSDFGVESAFFLSNEWKATGKFSLTYGFRYSSFFSLGNKYVYDYEPGVPRTNDNIIDSTFYEKGKVVKPFYGFEPRVSAKFNITAASSVKIGYNRMYQYIQQITNTTAALPTDRWQLSTPYIKPQFADQLSAGYFQNFSDNSYEASAEIYYKNIHNATDYKDGVNLLLNTIPETGILQGKGRAYGLELFVRKKKGMLTGWLSYTNSHSFLKIDSEHREERINGGDWYPSNFNKPHTANLVMIYKPKPRVSYSANFTYSSGRPATFPSDKYLVDGKYIPNYIGRNNESIPDYHRLDVSVTVDEKPSTRKWKGSWVISVYNLYGRKNAYSVFFKTKNDNIPLYAKKANAYQLSIFGTIFPSITYNFKF